MRKAQLQQLISGAGPGSWLGGHSFRVPAVPASSLLGAVGAVVILSLWQAAAPPPARTAPAPAQRAPQLTIHGPRFSNLATDALALPAAVQPAREIARLGSQAPRAREPVRERYLRSADLYRLMQELLPDAAAGERASQYYLYLLLGQCQAWLRLDAEGARAMYERVLLELNDRPADERLQWQSESRRCEAFAGGDLEPLRTAMGDDTPGSEVEYASIWFQRATAAGYPPALTEAALRINLLTVAERRAMLEEAVQSGDADVYWQLFLNNPGDGADPVSVSGMAWLILACRNGQDCSRGADWFRNAACMQEDASCTPGESAVEHYWYSLADPEHQSAWALANRIEQDLAAGRVDRMPWPSLASRNTYGNRQ